MANTKSVKQNRRRPPTSPANDNKETRVQSTFTEENYRIIFENSAVAITVTDENENLVSWNSHAAELLGMDDDDLYMKPIRSLYPEEEWKRIRSQNVRQKGMQHHIETRMIKKDQQIIDVDLSLSVLRNKAGDVTGSIGITTDITERKKAEHALRQSEELSRGMIEAAATGIYLAQKGRFIYVNRVMEEMSGYTSDELIGTLTVDYVHPDDRETTRQNAINAVKSQDSNPYEFRCLRKDLETMWVSERITTIEYEDNHAILGTLTDVTDRKIAEVASHEHINQIETLLSIGTQVSQSRNLNELLRSALESAAEVVNTAAAGIYLVDKATNELVLKMHRGFSDELLKSVSRMKMGRGFAGRVALTGKPVVLGNKSTDIRFDPSVFKKVGFQSLCSVPIIAREKILGTICVGSRNSNYFPEGDTRLLHSIATQIGVAIENVQLYEEAVETAITDSLTGLYNRRYFMEEIRREFARAGRNNTPLSVLMSDLDGLKPINDRFGHDQGDLLIKTWGAIIKENVRVSDVVARLGGDEFVLLAPETDLKEAGQLSQRLLSAANNCQIQIDGGVMGISVSIGLASYPDHATDAEEILRKADEAMYYAKRAGKNQICTADSVNAPPVTITLT